MGLPRLQEYHIQKEISNLPRHGMAQWRVALCHRAAGQICEVPGIINYSRL